MHSRFASSPQKRIVDRTKLEDLRKLIGEEKHNAAILNFRCELLACLEAVDGKTPEGASHAHRLAGVAGLPGFDDLEERCRDFLAATHQNVDVCQSTEALMQAAQRVRAVLENEFNSGRSKK